MEIFSRHSTLLTMIPRDEGELYAYGELVFGCDFAIWQIFQACQAGLDSHLLMNHRTKRLGDLHIQTH